MILNLIRYNHDKKSTQGILMLNGKFFCHTVEDEHRCEKVNGQTRIPEGNYPVEQRLEDTSLTKKYKAKFNWFDYHFEIKDIPNFKWVYIHIGNSELDTEGCLLVGDTAINDPDNISSRIGNSTIAYKRLYMAMKKAVSNNESITLLIEKL